MAADSATLDKILSYGSIGFGAVAAAAPRLFLGGYGLDQTASTRVMTRLWGTRNLVLGALYLATDSETGRRRMQQATLALNLADTALIATAGGVDSSSRTKGAVTTAVFAALSAARLRED